MSTVVTQTITRAELVVRAYTTGESHTMPSGSTEPTVADAARLVAEIGGLGTVERLDRAHAALVEAYRAGRRAERAELLVALAARHTASSQS